MARFGTTELIILLVIIVLVFGVGRIGKIAGELGSGIRAFRKGLSGEEKGEEARKADDKKASETTD
jgi:sec-independent protein translocase protein TatA